MGRVDRSVEYPDTLNPNRDVNIMLSTSMMLAVLLLIQHT
ncbi:hypothetical protein GPLA_2609 [Paraglaciecola polaris LMG 21857]|uniref:Uncharacterized protein n=1 Tax=Paraglaciecola polaris LMG 21857 TaxID=1129793 RepID=K6ZT96_9ALTE|nr:hypothetical protein GPLA_2609 [Paraglaciecola polaris LMG 21857]